METRTKTILGLVLLTGLLSACRDGIAESDSQPEESLSDPTSRYNYNTHGIDAGEKILFTNSNNDLIDLEVLSDECFVVDGINQGGYRDIGSLSDSILLCYVDNEENNDIWILSAENGTQTLEGITRIDDHAPEGVLTEGIIEEMSVFGANYITTEERAEIGDPIEGIEDGNWYYYNLGSQKTALTEGNESTTIRPVRIIPEN